WDEDVHGPFDTASNRCEYPCNFMWLCCYGDGTSEGCAYGLHRADNSQRRPRTLSRVFPYT
ncbi:hypothetical protein F5878DRAFT_550146, partial [Lentinula raphanica]